MSYAALYFKLRLLLTVLLCTCSAALEDNVSEEVKLVKYLGKSYDAHARPIHNFSESIHVNWTTQLFEVLEVDKKSCVTVDIFVELSWMDSFLTWNPKDFGGIDLLHRPIEEIWRPKFGMQFSSGHDMIIMSDKIASVAFSGLVVWTPHIHLRVFTPTDFTYFPHDEHRFHLTLVSWVPDTMMKFFITNESENWKFLNPGIEWDIRSAYSTHRTLQELREKFSGVSYIATVERRQTFYVYIIVYPCFAVGTIIILSMLMPHKQRFVVDSVLLLCLLIISSMVQEVLPSGLSRAPIIASILAFECTSLLIVFSYSLITFHIWKKNPKTSKIPHLIKKVLMNKFMSYLTSIPNSTADIFLKIKSSGPSVSYRQLSEEEIYASSTSLARTSGQEQQIPGMENINTNGIRDQVIRPGFVGKEGDDNEWKQLADILDKSFFILLSILSAIIVASICHP